MLFRTSNILEIYGPVTFLLYKLECYFFRIDVDIKLLLEFKESFGKFCPVFPKNSKIRSVKIVGFLNKILGEKMQ